MPLQRLARALRDAGVPVSTSEVLDATSALRHLDQADRSLLRTALSTTLVKRAEDAAAFEKLFEIHFAPRGRPRANAQDGSLDPGGNGRGGREVTTSLDRPDGPVAGDEEPSTALLDALVEALRRGDMDALRELAGMAIDRFGGMATATNSSERYFMYRVLRALELSELMARALRSEREEAPEEIDVQRVRRELTERIEAFRQLLASQIRVRLADMVGAADAARAASHLATEDTDFLGASPRQLAAMREAIRPLARALATRIARRRRRRDRGRLDVRRTVRRSLSTGGVPIDPVMRRPKASRPDLYVLCDVSGSVAEFASFTLTLLQAMTSEFPRMRCFAFVDGVDEVSDHLKDVASFLEVRHVLYRADVVRGDGHSDYGAVLERFWQEFGHGIDSRSTIIITGDARANHRAARLDVLQALHGRARRVYLLDPEPRSEWDTTDSIVATYREALDGVFEVRNLRQLADAVLRIS